MGTSFTKRNNNCRLASRGAALHEITYANLRLIGCSIIYYFQEFHIPTTAYLKLEAHSYLVSCFKHLIKWFWFNNLTIQFHSFMKCSSTHSGTWCIWWTVYHIHRNGHLLMIKYKLVKLQLNGANIANDSSSLNKFEFIASSETRIEILSQWVCNG